MGDIRCAICDGDEWERLGAVYSDIKHHQGAVTVVPAYSGTRRGMLNFALSDGFGNRIVDPYAQ